MPISPRLFFLSFCRKEKMKLSREFDKVDILPIGEDVRHLDELNTSDYDVNRLILERTEYQSRINVMLFAEQENK